MMITLTPSAIAQAKQLLANGPNAERALRVGIKGGGCSGMTYVLDLDDAAPKPTDQAFEQDGVKILVDAKSHQYLDGTTVDFQTSIMGGGFIFVNPQAKKSCGCGTSFTI